MLEQLSGQYESIAVNGLTTTLNLQTAGADTLTMPEPARVTIAAIQTGVEVTDLSLELQLGWIPPATLEWVAVRNVSAAVFGGRVTSEGGRLDVAHPDQTFTVKAEQLDLQQLLHLEQQKGLEGTGVLDGVIPVILTPTGMQVHDGVLEARPPGGVLRYQPAPRNRPGGRPSGFATCLWFCKRCLIFTTMHSNLGYSMRRTERSSSRQGWRERIQTGSKDARSTSISLSRRMFRRS